MPQPLWQIVRHSLQIAYLCFHFSVAALIAVQIVRRKQAFFKGFYVLYVIQSLFDVCSLFFQIPARLYVYAGDKLEVFNHSAAGIALHFAVGFCILSQECYHTAIAYNRYTAFKYLVDHERLWRGRCLLASIALSALVAFAGAFSRMFADTEVVYFADGISLVNRNLPSATATNVCMTSVVMATAAVCFLLETRSFMLYRALPCVAKGNHRDDCRLLVYAFSQLVVQVLLAVDYALLMLAASGSSAQILALTAYPYLNTLLSFGSSTCLFITSRLVRQTYLRVLGFRGSTNDFEASVIRVSPVTSQG